MASYGVFLAACGFEYHGPRGHLGFAPRLTPDNFQAAFTTAEGWGTYQQQTDGGTSGAVLTVRWGSLRVRTVSLAVPTKPGKVSVAVNGNPVEATHRWDQQRLMIELAKDQIIGTDGQLRVEIQ